MFFATTQSKLNFEMAASNIKFLGDREIVLCPSFDHLHLHYDDFMVLAEELQNEVFQETKSFKCNDHNCFFDEETCTKVEENVKEISDNYTITIQETYDGKKDTLNDKNKHEHFDLNFRYSDLLFEVEGQNRCYLGILPSEAVKEYNRPAKKDSNGMTIAAASKAHQVIVGSRALVRNYVVVFDMRPGMQKIENTNNDQQRDYNIVGIAERNFDYLPGSDIYKIDSIIHPKND